MQSNECMQAGHLTKLLAASKFNVYEQSLCISRLVLCAIRGKGRAVLVVRSARVLAAQTMSARDDGEFRVGPPGIKMGVMLKFAFASMAMVATPTGVFFLSHARYLDCALLASPYLLQ